MKGERVTSLQKLGEERVREKVTKTSWGRGEADRERRRTEKFERNPPNKE